MPPIGTHVDEVGGNFIEHLDDCRRERQISQLAVLEPGERAVKSLGVGEVGIVAAGIKTLADVRVGDTITTLSNAAEEPLPGFRESKPMVFSGLYPV